jgi:RNA polymerase primary sigma factor
MQLNSVRTNVNRRFKLDKSLAQYLMDIGKFELITSDEEAELAVRIREGDLEAQRKMVEANLKFVVSIAKLYQNQGLSLGDLINEGNLGLIKASKLFDETRGFKFISYAVWWIKQSIMSAIVNQSRIVRLPLNQVGNATKLKKIYLMLEEEYERKPTVTELAEIMDLPVEEVSFTLQNLNRELSIDAPIDSNDEDGENLISTIPDKSEKTPDKMLENESLKKDIETALSILSEKEKTIVCMSIGIGRKRGATLGEIGDKFDLTRERIRQIKERAIRKLKASEKSKVLQKYLG